MPFPFYYYLEWVAVWYSQATKNMAGNIQQIWPSQRHSWMSPNSGPYMGAQVTLHSLSFAARGWCYKVWYMLFPYNLPHDLSSWSCWNAEGRYSESVQVLEGKNESKSRKRRKNKIWSWKYSSEKRSQDIVSPYVFMVIILEMDVNFIIIQQILNWTLTKY